MSDVVTATNFGTQFAMTGLVWTITIRWLVMEGVWVVDRQNADIVDTLQLRSFTCQPFWATVCKTVRPMVSDTVICLSCLSCLWCWCIVAKRLDGSGCHLARRYSSAPGHIVLYGDPAPPKRGHTSNFRPTFVVAKRLDGSRCYLVRR